MRLNSVFKKPFFHYLSIIIITMIILILTLELWDANIYIPLAYDYDILLHFEIIKSLIDGKWFLENSFLGAPFGMEFYDFPLSDTLFIIMFKIISLFTGSFAVIFNVFYLFGFILTSITSFYVMKHFKISYWPAILSSILFTFLPYHFIRIFHLHLSAYFMVPLIIMIIIWAYKDETPLFFKITSNNKLKFDLKGRKTRISILFCILTASSGVYYAFFACFFLFVCILASLFSHDRLKRIISMIILISLLAISVIINIAPSLINNIINGENVLTAARGPAESDVYGLKISQLLIPYSDHGIELMKKVKQVYGQYPLNGEGSSYLGIAGIFGFLVLIFWIFRNRNINEDRSLLSTLSLLNMSAVLLATIGGFGSLFALFVSPQIRAYNRISIYIAFICLFAFAIVADYFIKKYKKSNSAHIFSVIVVCLLTIFAIWDQSYKSFVPNYESIKIKFNLEKQFFSEIESSLNENDKVFQLPYMPFPESPAVYKMTDYEHLKGYLHTNKIGWSYGAMKGRPADDWIKSIAMQDSVKMIESLSYAGFSGIYIDRFGYEDEAVKLETELNDILKQMPLVSEDKRRSFYNLKEFNSLNKMKYTDKEWSEKKDATLHTVLVNWRNTVREGIDENDWRWFPEEAILEITNTSNVEKKIEIEMGLKTGYEEKSKLDIKSELFDESFTINSVEKEYIKTINVTPGRHNITLYSDAMRVYAPQDPRVLVFRVINFKWREVEAEKEL